MSLTVTFNGTPDRSSEIDRKDDRKDDHHINLPLSRHTSSTFNRVITQLGLPPSSPNSDTVATQLSYKFFDAAAAQARSGFTRLIQQFNRLTIGSNNNPLTPNTGTQTRNAVFLYPDAGAAFKFGDKLTLKETRAFQICQLVGLPRAVVPSKSIKMNGHFQLPASDDSEAAILPPVVTNPEGVIQPFIPSKIGMFYALFSQTTDVRQELAAVIIQKLNLEDLQQKAIAQALLANFDFHSNNALLVPKGNDEFQDLSMYTSWSYYDNDKKEWERLDSFEYLLLHYYGKVINESTYVHANNFKKCMIKDNATLQKAFEIEWRLESPDNEDTFETDNKFHLFGSIPCIPVRNFILGLPQSEMPLTEKHQNWLLALQHKRDFLTNYCSQGSPGLWSFFDNELQGDLKEFLAHSEIDHLLKIGDRNTVLTKIPKMFLQKIISILDTKTCFKSLRSNEEITKPLSESILKNLSELEAIMHTHLPDTYEEYEDAFQELQLDIVCDPLTIHDTFERIFTAVYESEEFIMLSTKDPKAKETLWKLYNTLWNDTGTYSIEIEPQTTKYNDYLVANFFPLLTSSESSAFLERIRGCTEYIEFMRKKKDTFTTLKAALPSLINWNETTWGTYRDFFSTMKQAVSENYRSYHRYNAIYDRCTEVQKLFATDTTADTAITKCEALMKELENAFEPTLSGLYGHLFTYLTPFLDILTDIEAHYAPTNDLLTLRNDLLLEKTRSSIKVKGKEPDCYNVISCRTILNEALKLNILTEDSPLYKYLDEPLREVEARFAPQDDQEDHIVLAASSLAQ